MSFRSDSSCAIGYLNYYYRLPGVFPWWIVFVFVHRSMQVSPTNRDFSYQNTMYFADEFSLAERSEKRLKWIPSDESRKLQIRNPFHRSTTIATPLTVCRMCQMPLNARIVSVRANSTTFSVGHVGHIEIARISGTISLFHLSVILFVFGA